MKTKKQVIDDFVRLQKRFSDTIGFVTVQAYQSDTNFWSVKLMVTAFDANDITWTERLEWNHFTFYNGQDEIANEKRVEEFIKTMEGRRNG